jgi:hypothetical protein
VVYVPLTSDKVDYFLQHSGFFFLLPSQLDHHVYPNTRNERIIPGYINFHEKMQLNILWQHSMENSVYSTNITCQFKFILRCLSAQNYVKMIVKVHQGEFSSR